MSYLDIARSVDTECEKSELSEITTGPFRVSGEGSAEVPTPELVWMPVSREDVEASVPPVDWDGTLPAGCRWERLCRTLGPCPQHVSRSACQQQGAT